MPLAIEYSGKRKYFTYEMFKSLNYGESEGAISKELEQSQEMQSDIALFCSYNRHQNFEYTVILLVNSITNKGVTPYFRILFSLFRILYRKFYFA